MDLQIRGLGKQDTGIALTALGYLGSLTYRNVEQFFSLLFSVSMEHSPHSASQNRRGFVSLGRTFVTLETPLASVLLYYDIKFAFLHTTPCSW